MRCFCNSKKTFDNCCEPLLLGTQQAISSEQLMRSRFSAFAVGNINYLLKTSSKTLLPTLTEQDLLETANAYKFVHLEILPLITNNRSDIIREQNKVEFIAHLLIDNQHHQLHELSTFIKEDGDWKYDTGELTETPIIRLNRNDACPCLSGKKFKKCHMP